MQGNPFGAGSTAVRGVNSNVGFQMTERVGRMLRALHKLRFRLLGLATIKDIQTAQFNQLIQDLKSNGWRSTYQYQGFDAWIDYGCIKLRKRGETLKLEWDNWTEGSVEGRRAVIEKVANQFGLSVT